MKVNKEIFNLKKINNWRGIRNLDQIAFLAQRLEMEDLIIAKKIGFWEEEEEEKIMDYEYIC